MLIVGQVWVKQLVKCFPDPPAAENRLMAEWWRGSSCTAAVMASGGSTGFNHSKVVRNRGTNTTSAIVSRSYVPVAPKVSSNADTVVQPGSAKNPRAGCSTSCSSEYACGMG